MTEYLKQGYEFSVRVLILPGENPDFENRYGFGIRSMTRAFCAYNKGAKSFKYN